MDYIRLMDTQEGHDALARMMQAAVSGETPDGRFDSRLVDVEYALLVIEAAKLAEDREDWFPYGQWATIQAVQGRCAEQLRTLFANAPAEARAARCLGLDVGTLKGDQ